MLDDLDLGALPSPGSDMDLPSSADLGQEWKPDDTWFTPDRMKAIKDSASIAQKNEQGAANMQSEIMQNQLLVPAKFQQMQPLQLHTNRMAGGGSLHAKIAPMMKGTAGSFVHGQIRMPGAGSASPHISVGIKSPSAKIRFADGGALDHAAAGQQLAEAMHGMRGGPPTPAQGGALPLGLQQGPGDGRSDSIRSSTPSGEVATGDGEYVMPADAVSFLGRGSSHGGGKVLDEAVKHIRHLAQKELGALPSPKK